MLSSPNSYKHMCGGGVVETNVGSLASQMLDLPGPELTGNLVRFVAHRSLSGYQRDAVLFSGV